MSLVERLPTMRATIERRIFITYRADPAAVRPLVPERYELLLHDGWALGGVCLLQLASMRPDRTPRFVGVGSQNAAHRISIVGPDGAPAIWAPRRDSDSRLTSVLGRSLYPDAPGRCSVLEIDDGDRLDVAITAADGEPIASVRGRCTECALAPDSIFGSVRAISDFYRSGRCGFSPAKPGCDDHRIALELAHWNLALLDVDHAASVVFDPLVAAGHAELDHAVVLRDADSSWHLG